MRHVIGLMLNPKETPTCLIEERGEQVPHSEGKMPKSKDDTVIPLVLVHLYANGGLSVRPRVKVHQQRALNSERTYLATIKRIKIPTITLLVGRLRDG